MEALCHFNGLIVNVLNMKDEKFIFSCSYDVNFGYKIKQVSLTFYWLIKTMSMGYQFCFYLESLFHGWQRERKNCIKHVKRVDFYNDKPMAGG